MTNNRMFEQGCTSRGAVNLATQANRTVSGVGRRNNRHHNTEQPFDVEAFEAQTGWSWSDAVDEAAEIQRDERIFGKPGHKHRPRRRSRSSFDHVRFERETGMTYGDALEMAIDHRREKRWFGSRH